MTQIISPNDTGEIPPPTERLHVGDQTAIITGAETTGVLYPDADIDLPLDEQTLRGALAETRRQVVIADEGVVLDHTGGGRHEETVRLVDDILGLDDRPYPPVPPPLPPQPKGFTPITRPEPPKPAPPPTPKWAEPAAEYPPLRRSVPYVMPDDRPRGLGGLHRAPAPRWTRYAIGAVMVAWAIVVLIVLAVSR
jgi:hypothetical protein